MPYPEYISSMFEQLKTTEDIFNKIDLMNNISFNLLNYDIERSISLSIRAIELSKKIGGKLKYLNGFIWGHAYLSNAYLLAGDFAEAMRAASEMFPLIEHDAEFKEAYAHLLIVYSAALGRVADISGALTNLFNAVGIAEEIGQIELQSWALDSIATIYSESGDFKKALEYYLKAEKLKKDDKPWTAFLYTNIAANYLGLKDYTAALDYAHKSLELAEENNITRLKPHVLDLLGEIYCKIESYEQSLMYLHKARLIAEELGIKDLVMMIDLHCGQVCLRKNDDTAEEYFLNSLKQAERLGTLHEQYLCHEGLSGFYKKAGDFKKALFHYQNYHDLNTKFFEQNHNEAVRLLNIDHDTQTLRTQLENNEMLIREIHHRVKNNLNMVSSLLKLKAQNLNISGYVDDAVNQINAISLVHDKLYKQDLSADVNIKTYLIELLETIFSSFSAGNIEFDLDIEDLEVSAKSIGVIGLIINEAAVNALKHGCSPDESGWFRVCFYKDDVYKLSICNSLSGLQTGSAADEGDSLGMQLIRALVNQLRGELVITAEPDYCLDISFPG